MADKNKSRLEKRFNELADENGQIDLPTLINLMKEFKVKGW